MMGADKLANLNWGYVGKTMGYSGPVLLNPFTTGVNDDFFIKLGIDLANSGR